MLINAQQGMNWMCPRIFDSLGGGFTFPVRDTNDLSLNQMSTKPQRVVKILFYRVL
jgi:hypothetical protein